MTESEYRKKKIGSQDKWNIEDIRAGMEKYKVLYGKYPSTNNFDKVDFLPSSRLIQRNFGGIVKFKELLNLDAVKDYTKGEYRSQKAKESYHRAVTYEEEFYKFVTSKLPEVRVHEHKILRPGHVCCDFFIYTSSNTGIVIDLFYAQDINSLASIIRIKLRRYLELKLPVYFVLVGNENIKQTDIDILMNNKKILLPNNIKVIEENYFKSKIIIDLV